MVLSEEHKRNLHSLQFDSWAKEFDRVRQCVNSVCLIEPIVWH